jgi:hypothetical protein
MQIWLSKQHLGYTDKVEWTDKVDATISTTSVAILEAPDLEHVADRIAALRRFDSADLRPSGSSSRRPTRRRRRQLRADWSRSLMGRSPRDGWRRMACGVAAT